MAASPTLSFDNIRLATHSSAKADRAHAARADSMVLGSQASTLTLDSKKDTPVK